ncbi:MAG TPA: N-acetylmuramoyl-L-alanine amidase [Cellvibrionaceae bacterium]|nr:N-acetylmuramoyl-L-alanine amidase [Cellvibrionaceae bacterium]
MMRFWLLLLGLSLSLLSQAGQLLGVKTEPEFDTLRLSLELSAPTQFRYSLLDKPDRLVVELTATEAAEGFNAAAVKASPVSGLRPSASGKNLKLVFELDSPALVKAYKLRAGQRQPDRVVLELSGFKSVGAHSAAKPAPVADADDSEPRNKKSTGSNEAAAQREPSANKEPSASKEPSANKEPSAHKEPSASKEPSANKEPQASNGEAASDTKKSPLKGGGKASQDKSASAASSPQPKASTSENSRYDLQNTAAPLAGGKPEANQGKPEATQGTPEATQESHAPIRGRKIVVALDAGHGGKDTGAIGARGVREKDVVLAIARELSNLLSQDGRYKVVMTRSGDQFIPLKGRRDKARKLKADVFISIHADAFMNGQAKGASVFALSQRGATSEMARFLAEHENSSDLLGSVGGVSLGDKDEVLAGVLVDLSMTATLANSLDLGGRVLKELGRMAQLHNRTVEQAGFVVLKSPDVPSILVETGFISNPEEAAALNSPAYRQKIAQSIYRGVNSYFATQGPALAQPSRPEPANAATEERRVGPGFRSRCSPNQ